MKDAVPAFPQVDTVLVEEPYRSDWRRVTSVGGLSIRDYFAAKAIEGKADGQGISPKWLEVYARSAYALADAMLKAREVDS